MSKTLHTILFTALAAIAVWGVIDVAMLATHNGSMVARAASCGGCGGSGYVGNFPDFYDFYAPFYPAMPEITYYMPPPPGPYCTLTTSPAAFNAPGGTTKLTWTTYNATSISIDQGVGAVTPVAFGSTTAAVTSTKTFTATVTGPYGTVHCQAIVTVTPPVNGCILVLKETYDTASNPLTPVAQFTFRLDGGAVTVHNDASGNAVFSGVTAGTHTVTEEGLGSTWTQLSVTPAAGNVVVANGPTCAAVVFKNKQVLPPPPPPGPGCITITKKTFNTIGAPLTPVAQFTFKLDGATTTVNDASGDAGFVNVAPGIHTVTEVSAGPTWTTQSVTPASGQITVVSGSSCAHVTFENKQVLPPPHYGPYCGDGMVNQAWEQCDGGSSCTAQCQPTNTCVDLVAAKINITNVKNSLTHPGNMTSDLFVGGGDSAHKIPESVWFALSYNGTDITDPAIDGYENVPGLAVGRTAGLVHTRMFGSYASSTGDADPSYNEHVEGYVELFQGTVTSQVSDTDQNKVENPTDGNKELKAGKDEIWLSGGKSYFWLSVNHADDGFSTLYTSTAPNCHPNPNAPTCTLAAAPASFPAGGGSTTLTWTTTNATSFAIDHGIGSTTPTAGGSVAAPVTTSTTFIGTVVGPGGTATCSAPVTVAPPVGPACTLSISSSNINTGESVKVSWTSANATVGTIDQNVGATSPVSAGTSNDIFPPQSTTYTGTFGNGTATTTCQVSVTVHPGGGGCQGNCGGGLNPPTVSLIGHPGEEPLAFVYLSQIPYTGFPAGPVLTFLFWFAVALWSAGITYILLGKDGIRLVVGRFLTLPVQTPHAHIPHVHHEETILPSVVAIPMPATVMPAPAATDGVPALTDVLETRAHAAGILLSPEALAAATVLSTDRAETLQIFGNILNEAVRTVPREDGWILLSSERFAKLAGEPAAPAATPAPSVAEMVSMTPPAPVVASTRTLADEILAGNRDAAFALVRDAERAHADAFPLMTATASTFDQQYRAEPTNERLHRLVEIFAHALDTTYASAYTGVKLALAQAFETR